MIKLNTLCILITSVFLTLPLHAETSNVFDSVLSFFSSGSSQDSKCEDGKPFEEISAQLLSHTCPHFLVEQITKKDSNQMFFGLSNISAENSCSRFNIVDQVFTTGGPQEFENYLKNKKPFSDINNAPVSDCLRSSFPEAGSTSTRTLPEDKQKLILAEYYLTQQRLNQGMNKTLQSIAAIDQLIGSPPLNKIECNNFQLASDLFEECKSFQKCSASSEGNLRQSSKNTIMAMKAIRSIDQKIRSLKGPRNKNAEKNKEEIQALQKRKAFVQSLYPWTAGRIFQNGYEASFNENQTSQLIKDQMSYTRKKLKENLIEMQEADSCIKHSGNCNDIDFNKIMAKTPALDAEQIFQAGKINSINASELENLSKDQKEELKKDITALSYFNSVQCRQKLRENVSEANKELGLLFIEAGLTLVTVGLGSAAIAGKLALRAGAQISKAQRLQNLGFIGVSATLSAPYIQEAIDHCDDSMNQLEQKANRPIGNLCAELPVRSKLTSDLKSCILRASLASLPLTAPALAAAGRAVVQRTGRVLQNRPTALPDRRRLAEETLGKNLSDEQFQAIEKAHHIGDGAIGKDGVRLAQIGNYTASQLREKVRILKDAGFSREERLLLARNGIVGSKRDAKKKRKEIARNRRKNASGNQQNSNTAQAAPDNQQAPNTAHTAPSSSETLPQITPKNIKNYLSRPTEDIKAIDGFTKDLPKAPNRGIQQWLPERLNEMSSHIKLHGHLDELHSQKPKVYKRLEPGLWEIKQPNGERVYYGYDKDWSKHPHLLNMGNKSSQKNDIKNAERIWRETKEKLRPKTQTKIPKKLKSYITLLLPLKTETQLFCKKCPIKS